MPAGGSVIGGVPREKTARITDAMADLQLAIDGLRSRLPGSGGGRRSTQMGDGDQCTHALGSFARACSVFLRKTVLGDYGKRETRLLDDRVLGSIGPEFDRLRKIPRDSRRRISAGLGISGGFVQMTRLDDQTREPQETYRFPAGPQELRLSIEWPLPGAADWTGVPSEDAPWPVNANQLFQTFTGAGLSCDEWLAQQVVLFDQKGISLKKMIQTVVNFEAAHSIDVGSSCQLGRRDGLQGHARPQPAHSECCHVLWHPVRAPYRDRVRPLLVPEAVGSRHDHETERGHLHSHTSRLMSAGRGRIIPPGVGTVSRRDDALVLGRPEGGRAQDQGRELVGARTFLPPRLELSYIKDRNDRFENQNIPST